MNRSSFPPAIAATLLIAGLAMPWAAPQSEQAIRQEGPIRDVEVEPEVADARALQSDSSIKAISPPLRLRVALTLLRHRQFNETRAALDIVIRDLTPQDEALRTVATALRDSLADSTVRVPIAEIAKGLRETYGADLSRAAEAALWIMIGTRSPEATDERTDRDGISALKRLATECDDPRYSVEAEILHAMTAIRVPDYAEAQSAIERAKALLAEVNDPCCSMQVGEVEGRLCFLMERYDEAIAPLSSARELAERYDLASDQQTLEEFLGQSLLFMNRLDEALAHFDRALELARRLEMPRRAFGALESLGMAHCSTGKFELGNAAFAECTAIAEQLGDLGLRTLALRNVAFGHYAANDIDAARTALEAMRITAELAGDADSLLEAEVRLAEIAGIQGSFATMQSHAERALALENAPGFRTFAISAWSMLARAHAGLGDYDAALRECGIAIDEARGRGVRTTCADVLMLRSSILLELGDHAASLHSAREALELLRPNDPGALMARAQLHVATANLALRRFDEAAADARLARETAVDDEFTLLQSTWIEARIAIFREQFASALEFADAVRSKAEQIGNLDYVRRGALLAADAAIGAASRDAEDLTRLSPRIEVALAEAIGSENRRIRVAGRELSTRLSIARGDLAAARATIDAALSDVEDFAGTEAGVALGIERASSLRSNFSQLGELSQDLTAQELLAAGDDTAAIAEITVRGYQHVSRFKSRALLEGILDHRARGRTKETQRLVASRRDWIDRKERALIEAANHLRAKEPERAAQARQTAAQGAQEIARLDSELASAGARDAARVRDLAPDLNALRAAGHAGSGSIILDFVTSSTTLDVYRIDDTRLEVRTLGPIGEIEQAIERYRDLISNKNSLGSVADIAHLGRQLYERLLRPCLEPSGSDGRGLPSRIVIIPDGVISTLPFEALVVAASDAPKDFSTVEFALDRFDIRYAPSVSVLLELSQDSAVRPATTRGDSTTDQAALRQPRPALVFAEPAIGGAFPALPSAKVEGELVARQFSNSRLLIGEQAVSSSLDQDLRAFSVLHFAVHGTVNPSSPLGTGLWLRGPKGEPDLLSVSEVMDLDLDADLVVLSACSSSRGNYREGEGLESLARAFLFAGARSVVASQWELQDTAALHVMTAFYDEFGRGGRSAREALLDAKRMLRRQPSRPPSPADPPRGVGSVRTSPATGGMAITGHPYLWAPLIYIGADVSRP